MCGDHLTHVGRLDAQELYMRRIKLTGRFLHEHEVFVGACCAWCGQLLWR